MGICRNCIGKLSYTAVSSKKYVFSVTRTNEGKCKIYRHEPYISYSACFDYGLIIPEELPYFDSFIKAVAFMKANLESLR